MKKLKILLFGPFGGANLGDDYIAISMLNILKSSDDNFEITLTIIENDFSFSNFNNLNFINYPNIRNLEIEVLTTLNQFDFIIVCGGQQLSEPRVKNPLWGLLSNVFWVSQISKLYKIKLLVLSVGVNYPLSIIGRIQIRQIIKSANFFSH